MEPNTGFTLLQLSTESDSAISQKSSCSCEVKDDEIRRVASMVANFPTPSLPDSPFLQALGTQVFKQFHHNLALTGAAGQGRLGEKYM